MKKFLFIVSLSCVVSLGYSQEASQPIAPVVNVTDVPASPDMIPDNVSLHFAQCFSRFSYTDSNGNEDPNLSFDLKSAYGIYYTKNLKKGIFLRPELGYKNLGAVSILNNQKLDWSLHYMDLNFGVGYQKAFGPLHVYGGLAPYLSYVYKANQTIGPFYYDMLANNGIKRFDFGINIFAGVRYAFTKTNTVFFEIRNSTGLNQLETNSEPGEDQSLYNRSVSFHFGMSFNIFKKDAN